VFNTDVRKVVPILKLAILTKVLIIVG